MPEVAEQLPKQSYYGICPDTEIRMLITHTGVRPGVVLPPRLDAIPCLGVGCTLGAHVLLPVSVELAASLMEDDDDPDIGPDAARWPGSSREGADPVLQPDGGP